MQTCAAAAASTAACAAAAPRRHRAQHNDGRVSGGRTALDRARGAARQERLQRRRTFHRHRLRLPSTARPRPRPLTAPLRITPLPPLPALPELDGACRAGAAASELVAPCVCRIAKRLVGLAKPSDISTGLSDVLMNLTLHVRPSLSLQSRRPPAARCCAARGLAKCLAAPSSAVGPRIPRGMISRAKHGARVLARPAYAAGNN